MSHLRAAGVVVLLVFTACAATRERDGAEDTTTEGGPEGRAASAFNRARDVAQVGSLALAPEILTHHVDRERTGANLRETTLVTSNVNERTFGKLWEWTVSGQVFAEPLYVPKAFAGKDALIVATEDNRVIAFDAQAAEVAGSKLWEVQIGTPWEIELAGRAIPNLYPQAGITSTPVIDPRTRTLYVVAMETEAASFHGQELPPRVGYRLHALDLDHSGADKMPPVWVEPVLAPPHVFDPTVYVQRTALTLTTTGQIVFGFSSNFSDGGKYHGCVVSFSAVDLSYRATFEAMPHDNQGGIWQAGAGAASNETGDVFFFTGNGSTTADYGNSVIQLATGMGALDLVSFFKPHEVAKLNHDDDDLGSSGPMLLKRHGVLVGGGKEGLLYVMKPGRLGGFSGLEATQDHVLQIVDLAAREASGVHHQILGSPVFWDGPTGATVYVWPGSSHLSAIPLSGGSTRARASSDLPFGAGGGSVTRPHDFLDTSAIVNNVLDSAVTPSYGAQLALSADGNRAGTGILWANVFTGRSNTLVAYDASDVTRELYRSTRTEDMLSIVSRFGTPTVAGGRVFIGTHHLQGEAPAVVRGGTVAVYGLLPHPRASSDAGAGAGACAPSPLEQGADWGTLWNGYFGPGAANCAGCHGVPASSAYKHFPVDDVTSRGFWTALTTAKAPSTPLVTCCATTTSPLADPVFSPLAWFGSGNMPLGAPAVCNPAAVRAIDDWLAAGASFDAATPCACPGTP